MLQDAEIRYLKIFYGKKNTNLKFIFENSQVEVDYRVVDTLSGYEVKIILYKLADKKTA